MAGLEARFLLEDPDQAERLISRLEALDCCVQALPTLEFHDTYLDTPDTQVLRAGWEYCWRTVAGRRSVGLQAIAANGGVAGKRREIVQVVTAFPTAGERAPDGVVTRRLATLADGPLSELFEVLRRQSGYEIRTREGALLRIVLKHGQIQAKRPRARATAGRLEFDELAVTLQEGPGKALRSVVAELDRQPGVWPARLSDYQRGLQTIGVTPPPIWSPETRTLEDAEAVRRMHGRTLAAGDPIGLLIFRYLVEQFQEVLLHEPRAWEGLDPEGVHQMRVATRRLRAALRAFRRYLPPAVARSFSGGFKQVAAALGEVRDLDVYQANLEDYASEIADQDAACLGDYRLFLADQWRLARRRLLDYLSGDAYRQLKEQFRDVLIRGPLTEDSRVSADSIGGVARKVVGKRYRKVLRDGRAIQSTSPDDALHTLRIDCKRLRYLLEFFRPVFGQPLEPFIKPLKSLQDVLGEFQDARVASERLRAFASQVPMQDRNRGQLVALGQLIHSQRQLAATSRQSFDRAWKQFDCRRGRRRLLAILDQS